MSGIFVLLLALTVCLCVACGDKSPSASGTGSTTESGAETYTNEFVTTENGKFMYLGKEFRFLGTNNYYLHYKDNLMVESVLDAASEAGFNVIRMWGFFDGWEQENIGNKAYMQPEKNKYDMPKDAEGFSDCWERLDYVVNQAKMRDIKLVIAFTNYWTDFGGITQYLKWEGLNTEKKSQFYTNEGCKQAYKNYVSYFLNRTNRYTGTRYTDDSTIMAWELINEPRNQYGSPDVVTAWATEMSAYVKSIDKNHLVAIGEEGTLSDRTDLAYNGLGEDMYSGDEGVDYDALMGIDTIDFGTYHLYPESWGAADSPLEWGEKWIKDHIAIAKKHNKPTVLEEFGISALTQRNRELIYSQWAQTVYDEGGAGLMFWMLAGVDTGTCDEDGNYPDYDGFRLIYRKDGKHTPEMTALVAYAKLFKSYKVTFEERVFMIAPYLISREDEKGDVRFLEVDSDITPVYKVQAYVQTNKKIKYVEVYTNNDYVGDGVYNPENGFYEYDLEMKYYYRGMHIDIDVVATLSDGTQLRGERSRIRRILAFDYKDSFVSDYGDTEPAKATMQKYSNPSYEASFNSIEFAQFNGAGAYKVNATVDKYAYWCELKISVQGIAEELKKSHRIRYDVYFEEALCDPNTGKIPESPDPVDHLDAPGFRCYTALEPGWIKTGLNLNNTKISDESKLTRVTVGDKTYLKQTITIPYTPRPALTELVIGVVFDHIKYDGDLYITNLRLDERKFVGKPTDGFEERGVVKNPHEEGNLGLILGLSLGIGIPVVVAGAVLTIVLVKKNRKKIAKGGQCS